MAPVVSASSPRFTALRTASSKLSEFWKAHNAASRLFTTPLIPKSRGMFPTDASLSNVNNQGMQWFFLIQLLKELPIRGQNFSLSSHE